MPAAKSRLQHPSRALQLAQLSAVPKPTSQDTEMEDPTSGLTMQELMCNTTRELKENSSASGLEQLCGLVEEAPGMAVTFLVATALFTGDQLSQELKCVKNELKCVKNELKCVKNELERVKADKTAQCEAYRQTISSLQAQLRAAGICLEDAAVEE